MDKWRFVSRRTIERALRSLAASSHIGPTSKTQSIVLTSTVIFRLQVFIKYQGRLHGSAKNTRKSSKISNFPELKKSRFWSNPTFG
ncbi:Uncharacterized protein APZ42_008201 [Daphnia magna]|uniref:Uncharacterized protein n=1 Tax=Daphnia magna TaxID=35525 RepID=A0A162BT63_9CRUS|nr:Uncharacterized protein APZ42_008201 [Daphnia magna]